MIWAPHPQVDALLLRMSSLKLEPVLVAESHALLHLHDVMSCHVIIMSCHVMLCRVMSCHVMTWWMLSTTSSRSLSSTLLCTAQMSRVTLHRCHHQPPRTRSPGHHYPRTFSPECQYHPPARPQSSCHQTSPPCKEAAQHRLEEFMA